MRWRRRTDADIDQAIGNVTWERARPPLLDHHGGVRKRIQIFDEAGRTEKCIDIYGDSRTVITWRDGHTDVIPGACRECGTETGRAVERELLRGEDR